MEPSTNLSKAGTGTSVMDATASSVKVEKGLVSVIIPNWNGKRFLKGCLDSLLESGYPQVEVVMVDNGSKDGSVEFLESNYPQI